MMYWVQNAPIRRNRVINILLLGGSNTGIWGGWAHFFVVLAENNLRARVENGFLGAVGSLYGLFQLLKREKEGEPYPDVIIFEYTLNDINLTSRYFITNNLVHATLSDIACLCRQKNIALLFLCPEPVDQRALGPLNPGKYTQKLYDETAKKYGLLAPLTLEGSLGRKTNGDDYIDKDHLKPEPSRLVAEKLIYRLANFKKPQPKDFGPEESRAFTYVDATQAKIIGSASLTRLEKRVLKGPLLEMRRPSTAIWPAIGRLAGTIVLSNALSGWYELQIAGVSNRKNANVADLSVLAEVVSLQYSNLRRMARGDITTSMPEDQTALMQLAADRSHMERSPDQDFSQQAFCVAGLMLWRGPSGIQRLTELLNHRRLIFFHRLSELYRRLKPHLRRLRRRQIGVI